MRELQRYLGHEVHIFDNEIHQLINVYFIYKFNRLEDVSILILYKISLAALYYMCSYILKCVLLQKPVKPYELVKVM